MTSEDSDIKMPPADSKLEITKNEIVTIRKWIEQGAAFEGHWAFIPPQKSELPSVKKVDWVKNEIDRFILTNIEKQSLKPNDVATKEKLLRRVRFDLTGLPPTLEELESEAMVSGDWSAVKKRERSAGGLDQNNGHSCPGDRTLVCVKQALHEECECVENRRFP